MPEGTTQDFILVVTNGGFNIHPVGGYSNYYKSSQDGSVIVY